jgi:hypothetical protein
MLPTKFQFIWPCSFTEQIWLPYAILGRFLKIARKTAWLYELNLVGSNYRRFFINNAHLISFRFVNEHGCHRQFWLVDEMSNRSRVFHRCFLLTFWLFGHVVSETMFRNQPFGTKNCPYGSHVCLCKNLVGCIYGSPPGQLLISSRSVSEHSCHRQF